MTERRLDNEALAELTRLCEPGKWHPPVAYGIFIHPCLLELAEARKELAMWKPMTIEEAERAYADAEPVEMSAEQIDAMVKRATDPANSFTNQEITCGWVMVGQIENECRELVGENKRLREVLLRYGTPTVMGGMGTSAWPTCIACNEANFGGGIHHKEDCALASALTPAEGATQ